jgi:hypothetical protein
MKSMTDWTPDELARIGDADELDISSYRPNGSLRPFVTTWVVRVDDTLYVRSASPNNAWYRHADTAGTGRIRAGGAEKDVRFVAPLHDRGPIDDAYHDKYDHYGPRIWGPVLRDGVDQTTLRLIPLDWTTKPHHP